MAPVLPPLLVSLSQSAFGFGFAGDLSSSKISSPSRRPCTRHVTRGMPRRALAAVGLAAASVFAVASAVGTAAGFASSAVGAACAVVVAAAAAVASAAGVVSTVAVPVVADARGGGWLHERPTERPGAERGVRPPSLPSPSTASRAWATPAS